MIAEPSPHEQRGPLYRIAVSVPLLIRRIENTRSTRFAVFGLASYFAFAAFAYLPAWPGDPHLLVTCACGDPVQQSWFLGWFPWAVVHGHNPFFTNWIDYPLGANLAVNTEMPLLGVLTAPLSLFVSPLASYSLLLYLAYPLSAASAFFVLRRWSKSNVGAYAGGLLYGFSPYMVGQGQAHLNLMFVPLPPLIFMVLHELIIVQRWRPARAGITLGCLVVLQFFISIEVLLSTALIAAVAIVLTAVFRSRSIDRSRIAYIGHAVIPTLLPAILLAYPIYFALAGPRRWSGPTFPVGNHYRADLLGIVVPTASQLIAPGSTLGDRFALGPLENGSYLGIPLVLLVVVCVVMRRRDRWILLAAALAFVSYVLTLGPHLFADAQSTSIPLPFDLLSHVPLFDNLLPVRLSLYTTFFVCAVVARSLAATCSETRASSPIHHAPFGLFALGLVICVVISLLPNWPNREVRTSSTVSAFLSASAKPARWGVVLASPYPDYPWDDAMLWQLEDHWRWRLLGGYALIPIQGKASEDPERLAPFVVQRLLTSFDAAEGHLDAQTPTSANRLLVTKMRAYALHNHVDTVLFVPAGRAAPVIRSLFVRAFGVGTVTHGLEFWNLARQRRHR